MSIRRMDNVGIVVDDLETVLALRPSAPVTVPERPSVICARATKGEGMTDERTSAARIDEAATGIMPAQAFGMALVTGAFVVFLLAELVACPLLAVTRTGSPSVDA